MIAGRDTRTCTSPSTSAVSYSVTVKRPGFSPGDAYYSAVATGSVGPGNATKYVEANTAHHLAHVLDSLATHGVP